MSLRHRLFIIIVLLLFSRLPQSAAAPEDEGILRLGPSGDYFEPPNKLVVATRLYNRGKIPVFRVDIDSVRLESATLTAPALPLHLGEIASGHFAVIQVDFNSSGLAQHTEYELVVRGTYRTKEGDDRDDQERHEFTLRDHITLPPVSP